MQVTPITIPFVVRAKFSGLFPFIKAIYEVQMVSDLSELEETIGKIRFRRKSTQNPLIN